MSGAKCLYLGAVPVGWLLVASCTSAPAGGRCADGSDCAVSTSAAGTIDHDGAHATHPSTPAGQNMAGPDASLIDPEPLAFGVRFQDVAGMALDVVVVGCGADCTEVEAVVHGGNPPYELQWEDGSTQPIRRVCAADGAEGLSVRASDTAVRTDEFSYDAQMTTASIETRVFECTDAGTCEHGPGAETPEPGHYEGTGSYVCDNDANAESAALINHLAVSLDFEIDTSAQVQHGRAFFQWGLVVIAGDGRLEGALECGGALRASLHDGTWGLPGPEPKTVVPTGSVTGEFTARASGEPGKIIGTWHWTSMSVAGEYGNSCNGTYEAELTPT